VSYIDQDAGQARQTKRADARRNEETLLDAAAAIFAVSGVEVPIRAIAAKAGVGTATIYRHFPTRAELIVAVYRHQVEALVQAGPDLLAATTTPYEALSQWVRRFVDFLATKRGLATVLQSDDACFDPLHSYFLDRLVPVCTRLLDTAIASREIRSDLDAYGLMRGVASLCAGATDAHPYDAHQLVEILVAGLRT
jgi:AcrR family transcriptional regulator